MIKPFRPAKSIIIFNPRAGRLPKSTLVDRAASRFRHFGSEVSVAASHQLNEIHQIAKDAARTNYDAVYIAGGDGSIGAAANALAGSNVVMGVLPTGTANVWAKELNLPRVSPFNSQSLERVVDVLLDGEVRQVDLGYAHGRFFLLWAGIGLDAHIIRQIEPRPKYVKPLGPFYYTLAGGWAARNWRGVSLSIKINGTATQGHFLLIVINNIRQYAGGLGVLDPGARVNDGKLSLWTFAGDNFIDSVSHLYAFLRGTHKILPGVQHYLGSRFDIESSKPFGIQMDGEYVSSSPHIFVEIRPSALRVLVPRGGNPTIFHPDK